MTDIERLIDVAVTRATSEYSEKADEYSKMSDAEKSKYLEEKMEETRQMIKSVVRLDDDLLQTKLAHMDTTIGTRLGRVSDLVRRLTSLVGHYTQDKQLEVDHLNANADLLDKITGARKQ